MLQLTSARPRWTGTVTSNCLLEAIRNINYMWLAKVLQRCGLGIEVVGWQTVRHWPRCSGRTTTVYPRLIARSHPPE